MNKTRKYYKTNKKKSKKISNKKTRKCKFKKSAIIKKETCSPTSKYKFSCYSNKALHLLKKHWNLRHPDCKITTNDNYKIWTQLKNYMYFSCKRESCWLKQLMGDTLNNELEKFTFAPKSPTIWRKKPTTWLNSLDIENVMNQYEKKHNDFEFI